MTSRCDQSIGDITMADLMHIAEGLPDTTDTAMLFRVELAFRHRRIEIEDLRRFSSQHGKDKP